MSGRLEPGQVALVGAGPGDPELLTVRALKRLRQADVVVHDRLVPAAVLDECRPGTHRIDVGKAPGAHGRGQQAINELLIQLAREGLRVVRLKGGDPFVFGRGAEEALALAEAGIRYEVVPGVSSALAGPAAAAIPVTHRGLASSVTIATGHGAEAGEEPDWAAMAATRGTLVFLMGVAELDHITRLLRSYGRSAAEPAAVVEWATTPGQRCLAGTLADIAARAAQAHIAAPAVLVVGPTVALGQVLGEGLGEGPRSQPAVAERSHRAVALV
ncbi:MAG: uroporphyrinogen-III C-methyltransferase [Chloroflexi bacterium]|nr:uroporphyrinogen-III C-methyltransferase [Chloroflexota bacterium]